MYTPTAIDIAGVSALGQALMYGEDEEARRSDKWRGELAQRLEADLATIDSLAHGFAAAAPSRRLANRSPARIGLGRIAIAALAIVLGIAVIAFLGIRRASAEPPGPRLYDETVCDF